MLQAQISVCLEAVQGFSGRSMNFLNFSAHSSTLGTQDAAMKMRSASVKPPPRLSAKAATGIRVRNPPAQLAGMTPCRSHGGCTVHDLAGPCIRQN